MRRGAAGHAHEQASATTGFHTALAALDWAQPWWSAWSEVGQRVARCCLDGASLVDALNAEPGMPLRAVPQAALPAEQGYEAFIGSAKACPTRESLHDFFNGLCWIHMPHTKARINALHRAQESAHVKGAARGSVRDALTVLDENGALLCAPPALWLALRERHWQRAFTDLRSLWAQARWVPLGHALLEKMVAPRKDICAHLWAEPVPDVASPDVDRWLASRLNADLLASKPFTPLPMLGVPGWCVANGDPQFYEDPRVFRQPRGSA